MIVFVIMFRRLIIMTRETISLAIDKIAREVHPTKEQMLEVARKLFGDDIDFDTPQSNSEIMLFHANILMKYAQELLEGVLEELFVTREGA